MPESLFMEYEKYIPRTQVNFALRARINFQIFFLGAGGPFLTIRKILN